MIALSVENLEKTYAGNVQALKGVSFSVQENDFFALLGPNGAGKTTIIGIISTLVKKDRGRVKVFDTDLDENISQLKSYIGIVPQEFNFNIFETVEQIVLNQAGYYGIKRKAAAEVARHYLEKLDLWQKKDTQALKLSGGMKRRLMIARALVHQPRLLILDEPTAGVDIELRRSMWDFIIELNQKGTTIILTTHYLEEAENLCNTIAIIDEGLIIENTSMQGLLGKLDSQTLVLDFKKEIKHADLGLKSFSLRQTASHVAEVEIKDQQTVNQLFTELNERNLVVSNLRSKTNRLEELFIRLVEKP